MSNLRLAFCACIGFTFVLYNLCPGLLWSIFSLGALQHGTDWIYLLNLFLLSVLPNVFILAVLGFTLPVKVIRPVLFKNAAFVSITILYIIVTLGLIYIISLTYPMEVRASGAPLLPVAAINWTVSIITSAYVLYAIYSSRIYNQWRVARDKNP